MICGATGTRPLEVPPRTLNPTLRVRAALGDQGTRRVTGVPMTTLSATVPRTTGPAVTPEGGVAEATTAPTARQSRTPPDSNARRTDRCGRNRGMTTRPSVVVLAARQTGASQSRATLPDPRARCQGPVELWTTCAVESGPLVVAPVSGAVSGCERVCRACWGRSAVDRRHVGVV